MPTKSTVVAAVRGGVVRFGPTTVLRGVDIELHKGEVHAVVGQNGAGKSTLVKALTGVYSLSEGTVEVDGEAVHFDSAQDARRRGFEIVYQDQPLAPQLTVAENMFLGREDLRFGPVLDRAAMHRKAREALDEVKAEVSVSDLVQDLTPTQRVQVSVAAALAAKPRVLVLDEPTAALGAVESKPVFELVRAAAARGVAILYISHRLGEITSLADRITVLRNGERVHTGLARDLTTDQMIYWMVGQAIESLYPARAAQAGAAVLDVEGLTSGAIVNGLDMTIRSGEIVGLAGLVGSGASESLLALFGDRRGSGSVTLSGRPGLPRSPLGAVRRGIAYVPEERRTEAIFPGLSVRENIAAASLGLRSTVGVLRKKKERELAHELVRDLGIVATSPEQDIATLSGGNQQKAVVGRWLARGGQLYLVDEPTAGVDVSAKVEIYKQLSALATRGAAVLVVSSDFDELVGLCDRVLVVHDGRTSSEHPHGSISVDELTALAARPTGVETTAHASHGDRDRDGHRDAASESRTRASSPSRARNGSPRKRPWIRQIVLASAMVLVIAALIVGAPGFGTVGSLLDVVRQAGTPALLAAALAIALGGGAFDLSIGAVALFCSTLTAKLIVAGVDPMTTLLLGIVAGAVIGAVNGSLTVALKIPPFVSTLGMLFLLTGITLGINGGLATAIPAESPYLMFGQGYVGWIPVIGLIAALVVGGLWLLWHRTRWGLRLRAVGNDAGTSQMRGVNAAYTKLVALVISGAISGLAGALLSSYSSGATAPDLSLNLLVTALAAAFLGSAMTRSYLFDPATAAISALFVTAIGAGFIANGFSDKWLSGVQGIVLLLAVLLSVIRRRELGQVAIF